MKSLLTSTVKRLSLIYRIVIMLVTSILIVVLFPHTRHGEHYDYKVGAVWRGTTLVAPYDFAVMLSSGRRLSSTTASTPLPMPLLSSGSPISDSRLPSSVCFAVRSTVSIA